jgi:hypothetical protein
MRPRPRKSSTHVTLVLLGAAALAGCGPAGDAPASRRDLYASKEDCLADWNDPAECQERPVTSGGHTRSYWSGPVYHGGSSGRSSSSPSRSIGSHPAERGGFGASGHSHGSSAS